MRATREYKQFSFKADEYDEESGIFSGYAAVYGNVDSGGDIIEPGAFQGLFEEGWERVKILALHNDQWLPIGKPLEFRDDTNGLYIKAKISDTSLGQDVKVLLKDGVLNELSIGYDPINPTYDKDGIRHLTEVKLWEVSPVTWAMNPAAVITGYKAASQGIERMIAEAVGEQKEGRKISTARIKALKEASAGMKTAIQTIDAIVKEAEAARDDGKSNNPEPEKKAGQGQKPAEKAAEIEIIW